MIKLQNVSTGYYKQKVIENLTLTFRKGEFCSILGPNGAGKSTLLKAIIGFLPLSQGDIYIKDKNLNSWQRKELAKVISVIPQEITYQFDYTVTELVLMGRYPYRNFWQTYSAADRREVDAVLDELHLFPLRYKPYSQLSGGEKQRVNIARALVQKTEIILLDEALVHLDINHQLDIIKLLADINRHHNKLIVLISHNINLSSDYCDRIMILKDGQLFSEGTPQDVITVENLKRVYNTELQIFENPFTKKPNVFYK
ncbi:MAG: ABC transporter ATP-binding protein [Candidatus Cloacimonetes bacterium]|nr:ABC transporter ATP-binding protein [Candidatus Cloacimonadota bacterium]